MDVLSNFTLNSSLSSLKYIVPKNLVIKKIVPKTMPRKILLVSNPNNRRLNVLATFWFSARTENKNISLPISLFYKNFWLVKVFIRCISQWFGIWRVGKTLPVNYIVPFTIIKTNFSSRNSKLWDPPY
jgi:hypothetical protein